MVRWVDSFDDTKCAESPYAGIYKGYLKSNLLDDEYTATALLSTDAVKLEDGLTLRMFRFNGERTVELTMTRSNGG